METFDKESADRPSPFKDLLANKSQTQDESQMDPEISCAAAKKCISKVLAKKYNDEENAEFLKHQEAVPIDLDFIYDDSDHFVAELTEFYAYTEISDFDANKECFYELLEFYAYTEISDFDANKECFYELLEFYAYTEISDFDANKECFYELLGEDKRWVDLSMPEKRNATLKLLDNLEIACEEKRLAAIRSFAYLCQGNFAEIESESEFVQWCRSNCFLLYEMGVFLALFDTLKLRVDIGRDKTVAAGLGTANPGACTVGPYGTSAPSRKPSSQAASLSDCTELRIIISVIYTIIEVLRTPDLEDTAEQTDMREQFLEELGEPIVDGELPAVVIFQQVLSVASDKSSTIPTKKILLLLWKIILASLGGLDYVQEQRNTKRLEEGLDPLPEDAIKVVRQMRASTPPLTASELLDQQTNPSVNSAGSTSNLSISKKRSNAVSSNGTKKSELRANAAGDGSAGSGAMPRDSLSLDGLPDDDLDEGIDDNGGGGDSPDDEEVLVSLQPTPERPKEPRALPWQPKIRMKDIQDFLDHARVKYVGYKLKTEPEPDLTTLAGLPQPIKESISILKQHLYVPLSEVQFKREEQLFKNPISLGMHEKIPQTPTELLYKAIRPNLPQYMIALLKILLAATPTSPPQAKSDPVNLLSDLLPSQMPSGVMEAMKLTLNVNRHKEIIVKAVTALLLLLLKHFKLNHICQFEHCAQHMVFANCIPLVLKFFNQSIGNYIQAQNSIAPLEFPRCVIGEREEITEDNIKPVEKGANYYCWRNLFSCINLLRILNKLVKWKNSRIMMLVVFKSGPILKRALKVRHPMLQLYVLKLIKVQTKFLGRQWRKSNMKTMSAIYQKVRHRLHDDWAFGNELDSRPWDFQLEEGLLRSRLEKFNTRRYENIAHSDPVFTPVDNNLHSLLNQEIVLPKVFTDNYEQWLEKEVFMRNIDWDALLSSN